MNVLLRFIKVIGIAILFIFNENLDTLQKTIGLPQRISGGIIGFLLFYLIAELASDVLVYLYKRRKGMAYNKTDNVVVGLYNIYYMILVGGVIYFLLYFFKLKPTEFFTGLSLISAAIAVVMKDYLSNIISGMILAFSDKLKIGDYVLLGKHTGVIKDFSLTTIILKNDDDEIVYIPSNFTFMQDFVNYSSDGVDTVTIPFELNNKMKIPFLELEALIAASITPFKESFQNEDYGKLSVYDVNQESTTLKYTYTLNRKNLGLNKEIKKAVLKAIYENTKVHVL